MIEALRAILTDLTDGGDFNAQALVDLFTSFLKGIFDYVLENV